MAELPIDAPFPLDDYITDEWYPSTVLPLPGPVMEEPFGLFTAADSGRFWLLEGHWSRGMTPLCVSAANDVLWGTQYGANLYQLPPTKGQAARFVGAHAYVSDSPCCSEWEVMQRATRVEQLVGPAIVNFPVMWDARRDSIVAALAHFEGADLASMGLAEMRTYLGEFWAFHRWVWEVHFELMDPLIANYFGFRATCVELGIDEQDVARFYQGSETKIMETDREVWKLTAAARGTAVEVVLKANDPSASLAALRTSSDDTVKGWLNALDAFLNEYGWRTEGMCDPSLAPWVEDPTPLLAMITTFVRNGTDHDFVAAHESAVAERESTLERVRSTLDGDARQRFEEGLGACRHANFSWWQEEHNFYLDLRAHIPLRMAALRIGEIVGADRRDDLIYLFRHELDHIAAGRISYDAVRDVIVARRAYYEASRVRRSEMPAVLGTPPGGTDDPIMKEIFGVDHRLLATVGSVGADTMSLTGVPASSGVARGRARVIVEVTDLGDLEPDEILVCVFTSPNWTPAFAQIAGCVCDTGGALSHTAIVSREYRIPAVCATGAATKLIRTGDLIEVDGSAGVVTILERA
ncbi:MAG TPA: PEP-utilizing enzyme [Ilumatobacteraceae bacterium]|nr:PEP-utilizing enzyme [Ilumatobacteraceae bacterium]